MESQSKKTKAEKKATKKRERIEKLVAEEEERTRKRLEREGQTVWPLLKFIEELSDFPWNGLANNWGFEEGSESFELLPTKIAPPNDKIRIARIIRSTRQRTAGKGQASNNFPNLPQMNKYLVTVQWYYVSQKEYKTDTEPDLLRRGDAPHRIKIIFFRDSGFYLIPPLKITYFTK